MIHIKSLDEGLDLFKALGSDQRISIIKLLLENDGMNMNEIASSLNITNGALTSHIKKLEDCGIVSIEPDFGGHGNQKICKVHLDQIVIDVNRTQTKKNSYESEIKVGLYSDYNVTPTCGLSTAESIIGEVDDVRYFSNPDRINCDILWFTKGYVEYIVPNLIPYSEKVDELSISLEICSEAPGTNSNWPSDIHFYLNDTFLGYWTSPGDFGDVPGIFTPDWWYPDWNQYGLLKLILINKKGTFLDGLKISDVTIDQLNLDYRSIMKFRLAVPDEAAHIGGLTIYGKHFGNYNQGIKIRLCHSPIASSSKES